MKEYLDLITAFRHLPQPDSSSIEGFYVSSLQGVSPHYLGKSSSGIPVLLIKIPGGLEPPKGPTVLQHISIQHNVLCWIQDTSNAQPRELVVSIVRCTSVDRAIRECFLRVAGLVFAQIGEEPSREVLGQLFTRLSELFRAFEQPSRRAVQGLWAELLVIAGSTDPSVLLTCWHRDPEEAFDFSLGSDRVEVKSTSRSQRVHSFSLRQLRPGIGVEVIVASVLVERSTGGTSIADLMRVVAGHVGDTEAVFRMEDVVARSLGDSAGGCLSMTFDLERAISSIRYFEAKVLPAVDTNLPAGVSNVRFEALLDEELALDIHVLSERGGLLRSVIPRRSLRLS